ncbi:hypothetical protein K8O68_07240 [Salipaludibacillus sp. CUR1]|uniref:hypothetical protein n=1 Tax=Salipaludibacillus sp. CUR1 TaxID=2820003 RepID=UPI001E58B773|nr:hypothetical protein [Salipaludibacillus sp. CUR1]MCE7792219.1 hypothetical protein [Salipaludibacillus sp. CUR1]
MKQIMPFILIGLIVAGVMFFMRDDYEEPFRPELSDEVTESHWTATFFINDIGSDSAETGLRLESNNEQMTSEEITAIEFFAETDVGGFFYQDLELEDFNGVLLHEEACEACGQIEGETVQASAVVNWRESGETKTEHFNFRVLIN